MTEEFQAAKPIYMQIADRIIHQIVRKELLPGSKLPSVREMAVQSGVNPNTIQRTYSEMERMEIVETRRGQGTFVTENTVILEEIKKQLKKGIVEQFLKNMTDLGFNRGEIMEDIESYFEHKGVE
ncbi:GntR family transcriptional regulator [Falsibacillus pallidus]|uniref:GntR family transcriptional regulator n=1 Tax=Falsibacillus pallidus TaxID=493781 RepID=A0A370GNT2_9BACI|nr:GntR family transcriptional regulator [Falsibacillus pallidus]RDI44104.1 GntR family transcriptional regulator [Falsibacillus pallidus]